jgi:5'-phosphate synthase pdxT subunit
MDDRGPMCPCGGAGYAILTRQLLHMDRPRELPKLTQEKASDPGGTAVVYFTHGEPGEYDQIGWVHQFRELDHMGIRSMNMKLAWMAFREPNATQVVKEMAHNNIKKIVFFSAAISAEGIHSQSDIPGLVEKGQGLQGHRDSRPGRLLRSSHGHRGPQGEDRPSPGRVEIANGRAKQDLRKVFVPHPSVQERMKVGVVSVQGAFPEHLKAIREALHRSHLDGEAVSVRRRQEMAGLDAIILPGGESTTIARLMVRFGLYEGLVDLAKEGTPIMGTCAGEVLLAKEGDEEVAKTGTKLLGLMDMAVDRNAFGRQRESFEVELPIKGFDRPFHAIFIRAPLIRRVWGRCEELAHYHGGVVMARQDNLLALSFHPELSHDTRIHEMLVGMAKR